MKRPKPTEEELAAVVVAWLREWDWEVYQEVQFATHGSIADIVAVRGPVLWVIETKTSRSLRLLEQAIGWERFANRVSVAVPKLAWRERTRASSFFLICRRLDLGLLAVDVFGNAVREDCVATLRRRVLPSLRNALCDAQKTWARAGNPHSSRWSPFQQTARDLLRFVEQCDGCTVKEAVEGISHHYASDATARSSIVRWIREGAIDGLRVEGRRPLRLYLKKGVD